MGPTDVGQSGATRRVSPEDLLALYRSASTPHDAAVVIRERGRPSLALLVQTFTRTPPALVSAQLFAGWSKLVAAGGCRGWFEPHERSLPTHESARQVAAIFVWLVGVFERYAPLQPPIEETPIAEHCDTCGRELRSGVDCCPPPVKKPKKRRAKKKA